MPEKQTSLIPQEAITICDHLKVLKFSPALPFAFTEYGVAMDRGIGYECPESNCSVLEVVVEIM